MKIHFLILLLIFLSVLPTQRFASDVAPRADARGTASAQTGALEGDVETAIVHSKPASALVCDTLKSLPRNESEKMAFETGDISPICKPFVKFTRKELDRCGDSHKDPYASTTSQYTWASRSDMWKKGKTNLYTDPELRAQLPTLTKHIDDMKQSAAELCCGSDGMCKRAFERVEVSFCRPQTDPSVPDPCVFGGSYKMSGDGYTSIFQAIEHLYGDEENGEYRKIAERNLTPQEARSNPGGVKSGRIVLSSYVSKAEGPAILDPVILHEFGHACSMIRMEQWSLAGASAATAKPAVAQRAIRAARWLDSARSRCNPDLALPEAYGDFWTSLGESRELSACLYRLTAANQKQQVDRPCPGLCPGHYLEESVGIAFSLLLGNVSATGAGNEIGTVFPNTCDHVRDGQHPMVSDIADCLAQNSPRFRDKLKLAYHCQ